MGIGIIQQIRNWMYKRKHREIRYKMKTGQVKRGDIMVAQNQKNLMSDNEQAVYLILDNDPEAESFEYDFLAVSVEKAKENDFQPYDEMGLYANKQIYATKHTYRRLATKEWEHISMGRTRFTFEIGEKRRMEHSKLPRDMSHIEPIESI